VSAGRERGEKGEGKEKRKGGSTAGALTKIPLADLWSILPSHDVRQFFAGRGTEEKRKERERGRSEFSLQGHASLVLISN